MIAFSIVSPVSFPILGSSGLTTLIPGIPSGTTDTRILAGIPMIILITSIRSPVGDIQSISPWRFRLNSTELAQRGDYNGLIDGVIGPGSQTAIREFQAAAGLPVTGQIDDNLMEALRATDPGAAPEDSSVEPPTDSNSSVGPGPPEDSSVAPFQSPSPPAAPKQDTSPMASWVKGKEGQQVLSPFTGSVVDVSGFPPGAEVRCPYSGKIFLVPTKP